MNKKGFTLIELIAVITLFSIISLLVFGALTGSIKSASVKEMEVYKDNVSRAAQVYVETNLENYTLDSPGKYIVLKGAKIIEAGYLDKSIKNPSSCSIEEVNIRIYMESDYTLSYAVYCDGEEPPLSGDAEPIEPETPVTPETPETPSETSYAFEYTGAVQEMTLPAGKWELEVWGAQGGDGTLTSVTTVNDASGGKGGYSKGTILLSNSTKIYIYIGGRGITSNEAHDGGFNGGGSSTVTREHAYGTGGGATDIRIVTDSLYARVIVAGGGGGGPSISGGTPDGTVAGAVGGGISGGDAGYSYSSSHSSGPRLGGFGGTQISGGAGGSYQGASSNPGVYGIGGIFDDGNDNSYGSGTGGGGWYGGGCGGKGGTAGGGGSGWVYTEENFTTWKTGNPTDSANWLLPTKYYLTNALTIAGNQSFLDPNGTTVTGHSGNGYAKITWVSN